MLYLFLLLLLRPVKNSLPTDPNQVTCFADRASRVAQMVKNPPAMQET